MIENPTGGMVAHPGNVSLCAKKLQTFKNELFFLSFGDWFFSRFRVTEERIEEQLATCPINSALIMQIKPKLLIAAYSGDMDAVLILNFPKRLVKQYSLEVGMPLLTVNTFDGDYQGDASQVKTCGADIIPGDNYIGWSNFFPMIAEFLSNDLDTITERKREISTEEWQHTQKLAEAYMRQYPGRTRHGNPFISYKSSI